MGGCKCFFRTCSVSTARFPNMHFFHFPIRENERYKIWLKLAKAEQLLDYPLNVQRNRVVCARHFRDEMFMNYKKDKLVATAVPNITKLSTRYALDHEQSNEGGLEPIVQLDEPTAAHLIPPAEYKCTLYLKDLSLSEVLSQGECAEMQQKSILPPPVPAVRPSSSFNTKRKIMLENNSNIKKSKNMNKEDAVLIINDEDIEYEEMELEEEAVTVNDLGNSEVQNKEQPSPAEIASSSIVARRKILYNKKYKKNIKKQDPVYIIRDKVVKYDDMQLEEEAVVAAADDTEEQFENSGDTAITYEIESLLNFKPAATSTQSEDVAADSSELHKMHKSLQKEILLRTKMSEELLVYKKKNESLRENLKQLQQKLLDASHQQQMDEGLKQDSEEETKVLAKAHKDLQQKYEKLLHEQKQQVSSVSTSSCPVNKAEKMMQQPQLPTTTLTKAQHFNGIKKYLSPTMLAFVRMEMFGSSERVWKPDERRTAMELLQLGDQVYKHFTDEMRLRLPALREVRDWINQAAAIMQDDDEDDL